MNPIPHGFGTVFLEYLDGEGATESGIVLQHHVGLPKVYARVADVGAQSSGLRINDLVCLYPNAEQVIDWSGESFAVVHESSIRAVINADDGTPYFQEWDT